VLRRAIERRLLESGEPSFEAYLPLIEADDQERQRLLELARQLQAALRLRLRV
jgi:chemotaxis methyl-accepting protein methylase